MPYKLKIGDKVDIFFTVNELAEFLDKSRSYIVILEKRNIFPQANFRYSRDNWARHGNRIYSKTLAEGLKQAMSDNSKGKKMDQVTRATILKLFKEEKETHNLQNH